MLLIAAGLAVGCATPEERYRTLRIFFDDVPLPESMRPVQDVVDVAKIEPAASQVSKQPTFEWVIHDPECEECHTSKTTQLAYAEPPTLCWDCHDEEDFTDRFTHGPFGAGACLQCHTPHKSQHESLLIHPPEELCEGCHDDSTFAGRLQHREEQGDDCIDCHSPHAAAKGYMLDANFKPKPKPKPEPEPTPEPEAASGSGVGS